MEFWLSSHPHPFPSKKKNAINKTTLKQAWKSLRFPWRVGPEPLDHEENHNQEPVIDFALVEQGPAPGAHKRVLKDPHWGNGQIKRHHHDNICPQN